MLFDSRGRPIRRRIGFVDGYEPEPEEQPEVSLIGYRDRRGSGNTRGDGMNGWIGVDLDGTLATYDGWKGPKHIGAPVPAMVARVKGWLAESKEVRIFTARVWAPDTDLVRQNEAFDAEQVIREWCREHIGCELPVTYQKDFGMVELWDDRAVQIVPNTGMTLAEYQHALSQLAGK